MKNYRRLYRIGLFAIAGLCLLSAAGEVLVGIPWRRYYFPEQVPSHETEQVALLLMLGVLGMVEAVSLWFYRRLTTKA